jgi:hypothetical protein
MNETQILAELKLIRKLRWSQPGGFANLKLLEEPLVVDAARKPKGLPQRVKALRRKLEAARTRIARSEQGSPRSVANVGAALLRLDSKYEDLSLETIRDEVVAEWPKLNGKGHVKPSHFRANDEEPKVLMPFALQLLKMMTEHEGGARRSKGKRSSKQAPSIELSMATFLKGLEKQTYEERLRRIEKDGLLKIRDEEEMLSVLLELTELATQTLRAVDITPISRWSAGGRLEKYLDRQLSQVGERKISLERIHVVDEQKLEETPALSREILAFAKKHKDAGATLLICPSSVLRDLGTSFRAERGLLLVDGDEKGQSLAVTGKLNQNEVGDAFVYLREHDHMNQVRREYAGLRECVKAEEHSSKLRNEIERMAKASSGS